MFVARLPLYTSLPWQDVPLGILVILVAFAILNASSGISSLPRWAFYLVALARMHARQDSWPELHALNALVSHNKGGAGVLMQGFFPGIVLLALSSLALLSSKCTNTCT